MQMCYDILPQEIIDAYNLNEVVTSNGWVYIEIRKDIYGLRQAGLLANKLIVQRLDKFGYYPCEFTPKALTKFQHPKPARPQHEPYKSKPIQYGKKVQLAKDETPPQLMKEQIKHMQDIVDTLLFYACAVDPTMAAALSTIASEQATF